MDGDPYLPEEIIRNILKRLPVKSLIRFRCLCKQCKNLFNTPSFIEDHLHHSIHQNPSLLFVKGGSWYGPLKLDLLDCDMQVRRVQCPTLNGTLMIVNNIIGSSNGLLCVEIIDDDDDEDDDDDYDDDDILRPPPKSLWSWNPAIREVRQVTKTINDFQGRCYFGFGFTPIVDDYKIVRIYALDDYVEHEYDVKEERYVVEVERVDRVDQVEVYALRTGSWNEVEFGNLEGVSFSSK